MEEEIWKDKKDYEGIYQVSNLGRVRSLDRFIYVDGKKGKHKKFIKGKILKLIELKHGNYTQVVVGLCRKRFSVSRLVAETFLPNPENKPEVDHKNTDSTDNRVENLRWTTSLENHNNPLTKKHMSEAMKGRIPWNLGKKYTEEQCSNISKSLTGKYTYDKNSNAKAVLQFSLNGDFIREFSCIKEACECLGVSQPPISMCCHGKYKTAHGFIWKFKYKRKSI